jgi:hypothetical protein
MKDVPRRKGPRVSGQRVGGAEQQEHHQQAACPPAVLVRQGERAASLHVVGPVFVIGVTRLAQRYRDVTGISFESARFDGVVLYPLSMAACRLKVFHRFAFDPALVLRSCSRWHFDMVDSTLILPRERMGIQSVEVVPFPVQLYTIGSTTLSELLTVFALATSSLAPNR